MNVRLWGLMVINELTSTTSELNTRTSAALVLNDATESSGMGHPTAGEISAALRPLICRYLQQDEGELQWPSDSPPHLNTRPRGGGHAQLAPRWSAATAPDVGAPSTGAVDSSCKVLLIQG